MRVLIVDDLGFDHKGGGLFMSYHQNKERLAGLFKHRQPGRPRNKLHTMSDNSDVTKLLQQIGAKARLFFLGRAVTGTSLPPL
jgi:hypothetical protein